MHNCVATMMTRFKVASSRVLLGLAAGVIPVQFLGSQFATADASEWQTCKLVHKEQLTFTKTPTYLYRFACPLSAEIDLPVASCVVTRAPIGKLKEDKTNAFVIRPYTPVKGPKGHMDFAIKVYPEGKMSSYIHTLKLGEGLQVKGPIPKISVSKLAKHSHIGMIAGGTGITPMLQIIEEAIEKKLPLKMSLVYANVSPDDIMLRDRLETLARENQKTLKVYLVVDKTNEKSWPKELIGYVTKDMLRQIMPAPDGASMILVCGPPGMMNSVCGDKEPDKSQGPLTGILKELGYTSDNVFKF